MTNIEALRSGVGFDAHRFVPGRPLVLCGVVVPHTLGLDGHSDADVALHALIDSIAGIALGKDIGELFPDKDDRYRGIDSKILLKKTVELVHSAGFDIICTDITIIAQEPKLAPYTAEMKSIVGNILHIPKDSVSVKATTTEHLGFCGREEGIAAIANSLMMKKSGTFT